ncbi:MAG: 1-deoxy-D-xylulose-5-phosphate synthase [Lactovum sp.]
MILEKIKSPKDLKVLEPADRLELAKELRQVLLYKLSKVGGHNGPNLGVVELTLALHTVFNSPEDKLIFDISHQTYIHKMLTGRWESFTNEEKFKEITGYTDPTESEHDHFVIGHTSTSISLACGMAKARDLKGTTENVVAIIGDGALGGGLALEGLSNAGDFQSNLIIILNDNDQSIAENHGGLYQNLAELRAGKGKARSNLFTALGLDYHYIEDGHDIETLISKLSEVKESQKAVLVHVHTIKGKGFEAAEKNREAFHAGGALDLEKGDYKFKNTKETYTTKIASFLKNEMDQDQTVALITAGTPSVLGFKKEDREKYSKQFIDVGIAEEHAVTMSSAMAKAGAKPVFGVMSTFVQRTYDQLSHDLAINSNAATILIYLGGMGGMNDVSHLGFFDIPMINNIPNLVYLAATNLEEQLAMLKYAIHQKNHPTIIRVPVAELKETGKADLTDYSILNKYELTHKGSRLAIIGVGNFYQMAVETAELLKEKGINASLINPKFISALDEELLDSLLLDHELVITLEDGQLEGGFGQMIASYYSDKKIKVKNFGIKKQFIDKYNLEDFKKENSLSPSQIKDYSLQILK